jgi:hypothetical protein
LQVHDERLALDDKCCNKSFPSDRADYLSYRRVGLKAQKYRSVLWDRYEPTIAEYKSNTFPIGPEEEEEEGEEEKRDR